MINYFENIDTGEKAYWLGFAFADGFVNKEGNTFRFCLSVKDETHLDKFISMVGGARIDKRYYGPYKTSGKQVHFSVYGKEFCANLIKHGCVYKKSLIVRFPRQIPKKFYNHFLLGYYDGDGTEGKAVITSGSIDFLKDVKDIFKLNLAIQKKKSAYDFNIGHSLLRKLFELNMGLRRKRYIRKSEETTKTHPCENCGRLIVKRPSGLCDKCFRKTAKRLTINKGDLENAVTDGVPYEVLGRRFGVTGNAVKKTARRFGIILPVRRKLGSIPTRSTTCPGSSACIERSVPNR